MELGILTIQLLHASQMMARCSKPGLAKYACYSLW